MVNKSSRKRAGMARRRYKRRYYKRSAVIKNKAEIKYIEAEQLATAQDSTSLQFYPVSQAAQGAGQNQRTGYEQRNLFMMMRLYVQNANTTSSQTIRALVFRWNDTNTPISNEVLTMNAQPYWANPVQPNFRKTNALEILFDKTVVLGVASTDNAIKIFTKKISLGGHIQQYKGTLATDAIRGQIYVAFIGSRALAAADVLGGFSTLVGFTDP